MVVWLELVCGLIVEYFLVGICVSDLLGGMLLWVELLCGVDV